MHSKADKLAQYEVGWWQAHHRGNKKALLQRMAKLYQLLFNMSYSEAAKCVKHRVAAAKEHDLAEELEDKGKQKESNKHWKKAEQLLRKHFTLLVKSKLRSCC